MDNQRLNIRAQMTQNQFAALSCKLKRSALLNELMSIPHYKKFKKSRQCDINEVSKWLKNGWNTEYLIRNNLSELKGEVLRSSLHWIFPQCYYSVYTICLAFFNVAGFSESKHSSVISKIGRLMMDGKYPKTMSFLATGRPKNIYYYNIAKNQLPNSLFFNLTSEVVDSQICQFLSSTRKNDLREKKKSMGYLTSKGKKKLNYSSSDWDKVSSNQGPTSIFSLLYRKRIKSNYNEIDTFLCPILEPEIIYHNIIEIISSINIIHEAYILKGLGIDKYCSIQEELMTEVKEIVSLRMVRISNENSKSRSK